MFIKNQTHISTSLSSWPWQFGYCQTCKHCLTNQNLCCTGLMCQWAAVLLCRAHQLESYVSSMKVLVRALILHHSEHCQPSLTCLDIIANRWRWRREAARHLTNIRGYRGGSLESEPRPGPPFSTTEGFRVTQCRGAGPWLVAARSRDPGTSSHWLRSHGQQQPGSQSWNLKYLILVPQIG